MVQAFLLLMVLQLAGEVLAGMLRLPVPGMVIGLVLLLAWLRMRERRLGRDHAVPAPLGAVAQGLHTNFGLLFVPAGVGIVAHADLIAAEGTAVLVAVLVSTVIGMALAAGVATLGGAARRDLAEQRP